MRSVTVLASPTAAPVSLLGRFRALKAVGPGAVLSLTVVAISPLKSLSFGGTSCTKGLQLSCVEVNLFEANPRLK